MTNRVRPIGGRQGRYASAAGFSAIEMVMVVGIIGLLASMAIFQMGQAQPGFKGDGGMRVAMAQLNTARELSITQRRQMQVLFVGTNQYQIVRQEINGTTTVIQTVYMEGGVVFAVVSGLGDTPDGFGVNATKPTDFNGATKIFFNSDGTLIDQTGAPVNGTIYLAFNGTPLSARAVTVLGGTGRIRAYRWNGRAWILV